MSTDKADVYIDEKAVAAVDAKIRESQALTSGLMSSWAKPMEGVTDGPQGKITPPKQKTEIAQTPNAPSLARAAGGGFVVIPAQAVKIFKQLLPLLGDIEVRFSPEQKTLFLDALQEMPTPKVMADAQAIFKLMEALQK